MELTPDPVVQLLDRYEAYDFTGREAASGRSISGWQCENSFASPLIASVIQAASLVDHVAYSYIEDDDALKQQVQEFHRSTETYRAEKVFPAAGSNSLLFSFIAYLRTLNVQEIFYIPPLYFTIHQALRLFGIKTRPISAHHAFEQSFRMNLPNRRTYLLLSDPIWYAGVPIPSSVIEDIIKWQQTTGSRVFVDGTFQYMSWDKNLPEQTAKLQPHLTFRVVSPTKSLGIHGYRFAYILLPGDCYRAYSSVHGSIYSSTTVENRLFAHEAMDAVSQRKITNGLISLAKERYGRLIERNLIGACIQPVCGYFIFAEPKLPISTYPNLMDGSYFDQKRYPAYIRINLLSPGLTPFFK